MWMSFLMFFALALLSWALGYGYALQKETAHAAISIEQTSGALNHLLRSLNEYVITEGSGSAEEQLKKAGASFSEAYENTLEAMPRRELALHLGAVDPGPRFAVAIEG